MSVKTYNWNRYWVSREGSFAFGSEGFLLPPTEHAEWATWSKTDAVGFEKLVAFPCLILLGEPGIGKSYALRAARAWLETGNKSANFLSLNLGEYADEKRLIDDVFKSPEFAAWSSQSIDLHIFLDSFDECLLRLDTVATILAAQLTSLKKVEGLFIRITSRTAEWRMSLEEAMKRKWGNDKVAAFELAPLTKEQVLVAAEANVSDPEEFIRELLDREVVPFAIKPLTLELLFRVWKVGGGSLPPTQSEIYEKGCLELCSETNQDRDTPRLRRKLSPEERRTIASQIAAATVFCKRSAVYKGLKPSEILETDVSLSILAYGSVVDGGRSTPVTEEGVRETLDTGLFSARGPHRLGWAHQTYAEFLAARYVREQRFSSKQILDIIVHPFDEKKLVPQLHEAASWIARENDEIFHKLLSAEPDVLFRSDVASADDAVKAKIIDALLTAAGSPDFWPNWWALRSRYRKLAYRTLSAQLKKYLRKKTLSNNGRCEAIRMIEANELRKLIPMVSNFALDANGDQRVRETAAEVTFKLANAAARGILKPLALGVAGKDSGLELRGWGLKACWPGYITAEEIFNSIIEPSHRQNGTYAKFLSDDLVEGLPLSGLPIALRWAAIQPRNHTSPYRGCEMLVPQILRKAAQYLDHASVLQEFAPTLLSRLRNHDFAIGHEGENLNEVFKKMPEHRLRLVEAIIPFFIDPRLDALYLVRWGLKMVVADDFDWLLDRVKDEKKLNLRRNISHIIFAIFELGDAQRTDAVITVAEADPIFADVFSFWLKPMNLSSAEANKAKMFFDETEKHKREAAEREKPKVLMPSPAERICDLLAKFEAGNFDAWWQASTWAEFENDGQNAKDSWQINLEELPGWKNATDETKARIVIAAHRYVNECESKPEIWFYWKDKKYRPAISGLRALLLLSKRAPKLFASFSKNIWTGWLPAILRNEHYDERDEFRMLATSAFQIAPQESIHWILKVLNQENKESNYISILNKLPSDLGPVLGQALLDRLKRGRLKIGASNQLLELLVVQKVHGALVFCQSCVPKRPPKQIRRRAIALHSSRLLLSYGNGGDWAKINRLIMADADFGKSLFEGASHDYHREPSLLVRTLTEKDVSNLWEWFHVQYPVRNDPPERNSGSGGQVTTLWAMADIRDGLLGHLAELGTVAASKELLRLANKFTDLPWIRRMFSRGREQLRRKSWQPPLPEDLFKLAESQRSRLVQNADQLLDVVCDTIESLQFKLHGATPAARFLWHKDRPMDEGALSDWIKIELEEAMSKQGVVLNREVQIHIKERTDIHVDAITQDVRTKEHDRVKVIIEVKGCWHRELKTAMQTQLVNRYLASNDCQSGIYLVGWFRCSAWSKKDSRTKGLDFKSLKKLRSYLLDQAARLSSDVTHVRAVVLDISLPWIKKRKI